MSGVNDTPPSGVATPAAPAGPLPASGESPAPAPAPPAPPPGSPRVSPASVQSVQRLATPERILHGVFLLAFIVLVISGFMLLLPDETILRLRNLGLGVAEARQVLHRLAGAVMAACGVFHVVHVLATRRGRRFLKDIFPRLHDVRDVLQNLGWMLGRRAAPPRFHRFSYKQKAEYGALLAGSAIVCVTGVILWNSPQHGKFVVDLAKLVHGLEATLAACAIVVWHFYEVHWRPGNFLRNRTWIDGQMDLEEFRHDHGMEYERVFGDSPDPDSVREALGSQRRAPRAVVVALNAIALLLMAGVVVGGIWLARVQYFPRPGAGLAPAPGQGGTAGILPEHRFHRHTAADLAAPTENAPWCLRCHGYQAHWKGQDVAQQSILNMHERFLDCAVCHPPAGIAEGQRRYAWIADATRAPLPGPPPQRQPDRTYGAKISLVTPGPSGLTVLQPVPVTPALPRLKELGGRLPQAEQRALVREVHQQLSGTKVPCERCHQTDPLLDLAALGYPPARVEALTGARIWPLIRGGEGFYLPDFLGSGGPVREGPRP